ncbi:MAG TPA: dCTP deaminase [Dehalococcoidia bacterium]|nr:dCTP deaminase [Dehalococcoidia bacterium]
MPLSDREIWMELQAGSLQIDPLPSVEQVKSASIDLRLDKQVRVYKPAPTGVAITLSKVDANQIAEWATEWFDLDSAPYELKPNDRVAIGYTQEKITLPSFLSGRVEGRSSFARLGLTVHNTAPTIQPGFSGQIALELTNNGPFPLMLETGLIICQLILDRLAHPTSGYAGQFQNQVARG